MRLCLLAISLISILSLSAAKPLYVHAAYTDKEERTALAERLKELLNIVSVSQAQMKYNQKVFNLLSPYRGILNDKSTHIRNLKILIHKYETSKKNKEQKDKETVPAISQTQYLKSALQNDCKAELRLISLTDDIIAEFYDLTANHVLARIRNESLDHYRLLAEEVYILNRAHRNPRAAKVAGSYTDLKKLP